MTLKPTVPEQVDFNLVEVNGVPIQLFGKEEILTNTVQEVADTVGKELWAKKFRGESVPKLAATTLTTKGKVKSKDKKESKPNEDLQAETN
jgi:hypothetical protein